MTDLIEIGVMIDSREIAELTGKRHDHVIRDIKLQLEEQEISLPRFGGTYLDAQNKERPCFLLNEEQTLILITGYSIPLRAKVIKRLHELEMKNKSNLPDFTNPAIAARAWADEVERKMLAEKQVFEMRPKAEFYDRVTDTTGTIDMSNVSNIINIPEIGRNKLYAILRGMKILKPDNSPYQEYMNRGYFKVIEVETPVGIKLKTLVYQKGLDYIRKVVSE